MTYATDRSPDATKKGWCAVAQELKLFQVEVTFHPEALPPSSGPLFTFILNGKVIPPGEIMSIPVLSGIGMIVFNLKTTPGFREASFQTSAVQWFETGPNGEMRDNPVPAPGMFWVERSTDQVVRLIDFNSNHSNEVSEKTHWFNLVVAYEGKTYGADPSIVNEPPDGIPE
jgi:hypothetical protein